MIGQNIKRFRENLGISQEELAHRADVHSNTIARWERDEVSPRGTSLAKLANALQVSPAALLTGETDELERAAPEPVKAASTPAIPEAPSDCSGRLVIRQGDLYINLPDTPEGYSVLRAFFNTGGINSLAPMPQNR